jgi:hypothetical protein
MQEKSQILNPEPFIGLKEVCLGGDVGRQSQGLSLVLC